MTTPQPDLTNAPVGGTLVPGGATFRIWAPRAKNVYVSGDFNGWKHDDTSRLNSIAGGHWAGFIPGLGDGDQYLFWIDGTGSQGFKRDPRARALTVDPAFPKSNCELRNPFRFPWHETGFRPPAFNDAIIYQLHVGTYSIMPGSKEGHFLDVIGKVPYLAALGVTAIEPLPVQEFATEFSLGYNGTDYFSPENDYGEADETKLQGYLDAANTILGQAGQPGYASLDVIRGADNQLRAMVDICHVYGIAVMFDLVYNHAGGGFDDSSGLWFLDRMPYGDANNSLYFTDKGWAGGQVFAYWNNDVKQFLIDNAKLSYEEYRVDGFRFDEISVMDDFGGWPACQSITDTLRAKKPEAIQVAEYWPVNPAVVRPTSDRGAGFDATWHDGLRISVRAAIAAASMGSSSTVNMSAVAGAIGSQGLADRWRAVPCLENHDIVYTGRDPRIAKLADASNSRSWYARSRSRFAMGLLLTSPGIPLIFMGQEFLEDKPWSDTPNSANLLWWQGLDSDKTMSDFLRFTRELIGLRRSQPALCGEGCAIIHVHDQNRVLAFHRWVEGIGRDVVVVASLNENNWYNYQVGFPGGGRWAEVFNSDVYDNWVNPATAGNGGAVDASGPPMHEQPNSANVTIPANGLVVFART